MSFRPIPRLLGLYRAPSFDVPEGWAIVRPDGHTVTATLLGDGVVVRIWGSLKQAEDAYDACAYAFPRS